MEAGQQARPQEGADDDNDQMTSSPASLSGASLHGSDAARPQRPPRRISSNNSNNNASNGHDSRSSSAFSHLSSWSTSQSKDARSPLDRIKGAEAGCEEDVDRTPTKRSPFRTPPKDESTDNGNDHVKSGVRPEFEERRRLRGTHTEGNSDFSELERLSIPRLRHQSSTATIKSSDVLEEPLLHASTSTVKASVGPGSMREERRKRSAVYEQEIQQMRSESRLGNREDDGEGGRSYSRASSRRANDTTDTSGTEGSGPVVGNRRRKKSTTSSSGRKASAAARAASQRDHHSSPPKKISPRKEQASQHRKTSYSRGGSGVQTSPLRTESAMEPFSPDRSPVSRRAALPVDFRHTRYRSDALANEEEQEGARRRYSIGNPSREEMWPRGEELPSTRAEGTGERRRRQVSDAHSSEGARVSPSESSSRPARISVDASGVSRHLSRSNNRYGAVNEGRNVPSDWSDKGSNRSASEILRQRKISTSSSLSQRSSGGASELHRSASRASMRKSHGRDVFDDGGAPPLPENSSHPLSPRFLTVDMQHEQAQAMTLSLMQKQDRLRESRAGEGWRREVEDLQMRIDQLTMAAGGESSGYTPDPRSRSSSRTSLSAPRSTISSTPSTQIGTRGSNRPSTEPRLTRNGHDRATSELTPAYHRYDGSSSRLGLGEGGGERELPVTPNMSDVRAATSQRLSGAQTGPLPSTSRFSSVGQSAKRSAPSSTGSGPLHERNLLSSVEVFERYLLDSSRPPHLDSPSVVGRSASEAVELVNKFKETSEAAMNINSGLRSLLQSVLECQIDSEVGDRNLDNSRLLSNIDRALSLILRDSDEQMRSLTDGLINFTRAEKERDRMRRLGSEQSASGSATMPRSASRLSSLGLSQVSPEKERTASRMAEMEAERRSTSMEVRRRLSVRDREPREPRMPASLSGTSMQALESHSQTSDRSSRSGGGQEGLNRQSNDAGGPPRFHTQQSQISRRFSLLNDSNSSLGSNTSSKFPPSPYSPSPNPNNSSSLASSRIRASITSPTLELARRSTLGGISHARSASELSPKVTEGPESPNALQRSPLIRRDKSSSNSTNTVKAPASLSPRRPRLSFPKVSTTTVAATTTVGDGNPTTFSTNDDGREVQDAARVMTNGDEGLLEPSASSYNDHTLLTSENLKQNSNNNNNNPSSLEAAARMFRSIGRGGAKRASRELSEARM